MFSGIIGNQEIKETLYNSIKNNKLSHSYLFIGIEGIGKKMIAKQFAKYLLCFNNGQEEEKCESCIKFDTNNHPDYSEILLDGNSIKIEQIRQMQKKVQEKPIISTRKIYIIDNADKMTRRSSKCTIKNIRRTT